MTLYGSGKQTRAFININDSIKCLTLAIEYGQKNDLSKINILNQMTASHELNDLKDLLVKLYPEAKYEYIENPREEKAENSLKVINEKFKEMGHKGIFVNEEDLKKLVEVCRTHHDRWELNLPYIKPVSFWKKQQK